MLADNNADRGESAKQRAVIKESLGAAKRRLVSRRLINALGASLFLPVSIAASWIILSRFTVFEPPKWPVLLPLLVWITAILVWSRSGKRTVTECAVYLDRELRLDQRLLTYLELETRRSMGVAPSAFMVTLRNDTAELIKKNWPFLESAYASKLRLAQMLPALLAFGALLVSMLLPSQFDEIKAQRRLVARTLENQVAAISQLRADLVARPNLENSLRTTLDAQLRDLEVQLSATDTNREDALAQIAAVEDKVHALQPAMSPAEFDAFVASAKLVQSGAAQSTDWDPSLSAQSDDLGRAAEALDHTKTYLNQFSTVQARGMASSLESASDQALTKDPTLAGHLSAAAAALRKVDHAGADAELEAARVRFSELQKQQQSSEAVANTLSKLADSRQEIAKAGTQAAKRGQVGFRRSLDATTAQSQDGGSGTHTPDAGKTGDATGGTNSAPSLQGPAPGSGRTAASGQPQAGGITQPGGQPGSAGPKGSNGAQGSRSGTGGNGGSTGTNQTGGSGAGQGGGSGGTGTQQGAVSGPVRVGGATTGGGGAAGNGAARDTGTQSQNTAGQPSERLFVPGSEPAARTGVGGQASPESANGANGRVGEGATGGGTSADPGPGQLTQVRTPYKEVLGQYSRQATDALDRAYVPPDAKEYVRDYFSQLGK